MSGETDRALPGKGPGPDGGGDRPGKGNRTRALAWVAGVVATLLAAGVVAFYRVPAFHRLLHPDEAGDAGKPSSRIVKYTCPMHPFIEEDHPAACPICGMNLVPVESEAAGAEGADELARILGGVTITPTQRLMANVATETVGRHRFERTTEALGTVAWDERRVETVSSRIGGRVEKLFVDFTGTRVEKGAPLLEIYSPDLVATQREYLLALGSRDRMKESPYEDAREMAERLVEASRDRLRLWGISEEQIAELERTAAPKTVFPIVAPASGVVTERLVSAGQYVAEGTPLFAIARPDPVWVVADVYEYELHKVPVGARARITSEAYPGREFPGSVSFVDPFVNPVSRTVRVRIDLSNPKGLLKPDMFVRVSLRSGGGSALAVPETAVLVTGERAIVWVETEENVFHPRNVKLGFRSGGFYEVLDGLSGGESVATQAGYLIDSESQIRLGHSGGHAGHGEPPSGSPGAGTEPGDPAGSGSPPPGGHSH